MHFGRKGTWIAFAFFCLMEMAAFPYSVLAYTVSPIQTPTLSPVTFEIQNYNNTNDYWWGVRDLNTQVFYSACEKKTVGNDVTITMVGDVPIGNYPLGSIGYVRGAPTIDDCIYGNEVTYNPNDFDVVSQLAVEQNTSTLVIASIGAVLWDEVVSNILTILSICTAVALIFWAFNAFKRWTK